MAKKITVKELLGFELSLKEITFIIEYCKDFSARRAAEAAGYHPDHGYRLTEDERIKVAVDHVVTQRLDAANIDAEWVLAELVDNHHIARQQGKISASNVALATIAKHAAVDAFAADKVMTINDQAIIDRLLRARKRAAAPAEEVSFL